MARSMIMMLNGMDTLPMLMSLKCNSLTPSKMNLLV